MTRAGVSFRLFMIGLSAMIGLIGMPSPSAKATVAHESGIEIDRIDVLGVKEFTNQVIESSLEISPGDPLDKPKVVRTEENLQALYLSRGYEEVRIRSRLVRKKGEKNRLETVLEFSVIEGRPTRVSSVRIIPKRMTGRAMNRAWRNREKNLSAMIKLRSGDILDQEKMVESKRELQELLATEEFVGAKVDEVTIPGATPPAEDYGETAQWVNVEFHVDFGDKVSFGFRGNTVFSRGYLNSLIAEQRVVGLGRDYIGAIRSILEEEYRSRGYAKVKIVPFSFEGKGKDGRKVTYVIQEGPCVKIDEIEFDGNLIFSNETLKKEFHDRASSAIQNGVYVEKEMQKSAERLIEWMKEQGYLSSKLTAISAHYPILPKTKQPNSSIQLQVYLYEGDQTIVKGANISGARVLSPDEVTNILKVKVGMPLNLFAFGEGVEELKRIYRNRGYFDFRILNEGSQESSGPLTLYKNENHEAEIQIHLDEGRQFRVGQIAIEGLTRTKDFVVLRELTFHEGEILTESAIVESERSLRRLGIFSSVGIRTVDDAESPDKKSVRILLAEADRGTLTVGPGLRNDLGVRLFGQLSYANLWGLDHTVLLNINMNRRFYLYNFLEAQAQFSYVWPWFGLPGLTFHPATSGGRTQYINFATQSINFVADTLTVSAAWDKMLLKNPNLSASFAHTLELIRQFSAPDPSNNDSLLIGSVTPRLSLDLRDNALSPTSGFYTTAWVDLAAPYLGARSDIGFYRLQFRSDYHLPLFSGKVIWYASVRAGHERNFGASEDPITGAPRRSFIPLIKQFALGGVGSLRGYQELELNKQDRQIHGGLSYVNYRTQLDLPVSGSLKFGPFIDAATLFVDDYFEPLKYGVGCGFHYLTPVGPVNLDLGFKVDPPEPKAGAKKDDYVVHFSVGII